MNAFHGMCLRLCKIWERRRAFGALTLSMCARVVLTVGIGIISTTACGLGGSRSRLPAEDALGLRGGAVPTDDEQVMTDALRLVREKIGDPSGGTNGKHPALRRGEGRAVFLTLYRPGTEPLTVAGKGRTLLASILLAADQLASSDQQLVTELENARIKIDVAETAGMRYWDLEPSRLPMAPEVVGLDGIAIVADGRIGFVTPGEIIERRLYDTSRRGLRKKRLIELLEDRCACEIGFEEPLIAFTTSSWIETANRERALRLYRTHPSARPGISPDIVAERIQLTADFLARICDEGGAFIVPPVSLEAEVDEPGPSEVSSLRSHANATYALLASFRQTGDADHLQAARRALKRLMQSTQLIPLSGPWGPDYRYPIRKQYARTDLAGLTLLALAEYVEITGDRTVLPWMHQMARFIGYTLTEHRGFPSHLPLDRSGEIRYRKNGRHLGQAAYGLLRLARIDHNMKYYRWAAEILTLVIEVRDAGKTPWQNRTDDPWLVSALAQLHDRSRIEDLAQHALSLARGIRTEFLRSSEGLGLSYPDYDGAVNSPPSTLSVARRVASVGQAMRLPSLDSEGRRMLHETATSGVAWLLWLQFTPDSAYFPRDPASALGGFPRSLADPAIALDVASLSIWAMLDLASMSQEFPDGAGAS